MIFIIVDKFIKQGYFIIYIEEISAEDIVQIYIKEVFVRYGAPAKIILDRNTKFITAFQKVFIVEQGIKAIISTAYHP